MSLTREELEKLSDLELSLNAAMHVMGWEIEFDQDDGGRAYFVTGDPARPSIPCEEFQPATDPTASRELRRKMEADGWRYSTGHDGSGYWSEFSEPPLSQRVALETWEFNGVKGSQTEERAVAIAALLARGV